MMKNCAKKPMALLIAALLIAAAVPGLTGCSSPSGNGEDDYHTVAFDVSGGVPAPQSQSVANGGKAAEPSPVPAREGYVLEGWYTEAAATNRWDFAVDTVTADITLYAKWLPAEEGSWTVSFNAAGGSPAPGAQTVNDGGKAAVPEPVPVREGYVLEGWYTEAAYTNRWDFAVDTVTADITLYAKWTLKQYTVTFNSSGGGAVEAQTVEHGDKAAEPEPPVNGALILEGWYKESSLTTRWDFDSDTVTADITLYAAWVEVLPGYHLVSFNSRGGAAVAAQTVAENGRAEEPDPPARNNYVFDG
ncbi:MAG: InlB B-repeat-containing protein [Treponema sp.]|jgi:uncharacterized repeat protein (TIGR02543 family)|nr:InlB B-repeat-containing protein [Treponema sp.]